MPRVQIQIVIWNNRKDIAAAVQSVMAQTWRDYSLIIVDNASEDGTRDLLKSFGRDITVLVNRQNLGFAQAHNQAYAFAIQSRVIPEYIVVMNPDGTLTPRFLEHMIVFAEAHGNGASFNGKVLREPTDAAATIDTTGIMMTKSCRAYDRGAGEIDRGQYNGSTCIFGASGALALYRVSALKALIPGFHMYDPHFFMYKEDVDLAWRLERAGYCAYYVPEAVAYHARTVRATKKGVIGHIAGELAKDPFKKYLSYRNQWLLLVKNLSAQTLLYRFPWIMADRILEGLFMVLVRPQYFIRAHIDMIRFGYHARQRKAV